MRRQTTPDLRQATQWARSTWRAYFACMANDRQALQEQLELIGDKFDKTFWGDNPERTYEVCKKAAQQT
jgi:hypothetical protein